MHAYGVGFNSHKLKAKQQTSIGIPLQPVETGISLGRSIPPQGSVAQCLCVFYHQGLSTCNSEAFLSLTAQISHWSHHGSVFPKPYDGIFPIVILTPLHLQASYGMFLWEMTATSVRVTLLPSFPYTLVTQWNKQNACTQLNQLQHLPPKCASISTNSIMPINKWQFEQVLKTSRQLLQKFMCVCW